MKKFLLSLIVFASIAAYAQSQTEVDSSRISQTIIVSEIQHIYIIGAMTSIDNADAFNYIKQVKAAYDPADTSKRITVTVSSQLIANIYQMMTAKAEGVTAVYNNDIKAALMPQITNAWLGTQLYQIAVENARQLNLILARGKNFIESIQ
jgi:methyltransferase-like protein